MVVTELWGGKSVELVRQCPHDQKFADDAGFFFVYGPPDVAG